MRSSGDKGGPGVRRAARGVFHLGPPWAGRGAWRGPARPALKAALFCPPLICHRPDVTGLVWVADFKGAFQIFLIFLFQG